MTEEIELSPKFEQLLQCIENLRLLIVDEHDDETYAQNAIDPIIKELSRKTHILREHVGYRTMNSPTVKELTLHSEKFIISKNTHCILFCNKTQPVIGVVAGTHQRGVGAQNVIRATASVTQHKRALAVLVSSETMKMIAKSTLRWIAGAGRPPRMIAMRIAASEYFTPMFTLGLSVVATGENALYPPAVLIDRVHLGKFCRALDVNHVVCARRPAQRNTAVDEISSLDAAIFAAQQAVFNDPDADVEQVVGLSLDESFSMSSGNRAPGGKRGDDVSPQARATFYPHEFDDRISEPGTKNPTSKFEARLKIILGCATALLTQAAGNVDAIKPDDLFYLVRLCFLHMQKSSNTDTVHRDVLSLAYKIRAEKLAFASTHDAASNFCTMDLPDLILRSLRAPSVAEFLTETRLHEVLEQFQLAPTAILRARQIVLEKLMFTSVEMVSRFIDTNCLEAEKHMLRKMIAGGQVMCAGLSFDKCTPLQMVASIRRWLPDARDGVDFFVVWCSKSTRICIVIAIKTWRRLAIGVIPRCVAEKAVAKVSVADEPLVSIKLNLALASVDPLIRAHALAAVRALAGGEIELPHPRTDETSARVDTLRRFAMSLATRGNIFDQVANPILELQQAFDNGTPQSNDIDTPSAAVYAMLASHNETIIMSRAAAIRAISSPSIDRVFAAYLATQMAQTVPASSLPRVRETLRTLQSNLLLQEPPQYGPCRCLATHSNCTRMVGGYGKWKELASAGEFDVRECVECCLCAEAGRLAELCGIGETLQARAIVPCANCAQRAVLPICSLPSGVVPVYSANLNNPPYHIADISRFLLSTGTPEILFSLRVVRNGRIKNVAYATEKDSPRKAVLDNGTFPVALAASRRYLDEQTTSVTRGLERFFLPHNDEGALFDLLYALEVMASGNHRRIAQRPENYTHAISSSERAVGLKFERVHHLVTYRSVHFPLGGAAGLDPSAEAAGPRRERLENFLYCGRHAAPLAGALPGLLDLLLLNFHEMSPDDE